MRISFGEAQGPDEIANAVKVFAGEIAAPKEKRSGKSSLRFPKGMEFPPRLEADSLGHVPARLRSISRVHEAIALRRELVAEALKRQKVVTTPEIIEHLKDALFPVADPYYTKEISPGQVRLISSIHNDLAYFVKRKWERKIGKGKWHWLKAGVTPPDVILAEMSTGNEMADRSWSTSTPRRVESVLSSWSATLQVLEQRGTPACVDSL